MERLFTSAEVCASEGCSPVTLWRWVKAGIYPAPIKTGPNSVRFRESEIEARRAALPRVDYAPDEAASSHTRKSAPR